MPLASETFFAGINKASLYLAEARYSLPYIRPYVDGLRARGRVLEIGSGPGILLHEIAQRREDLQVQGVEPFGCGFEFFDRFVSKVKAEHPNLQIYLGGYESFPDKGPFDLIYSVNVFEHLPDWRHFLSFLRDRLSPAGQCVILCPNYGFPFESHFNLPIILNKSITHRFFSRRIAQFEKEHDCCGLWESLNFVRFSAVVSACRQRQLVVVSKPEICLDMVDRLKRDQEFAARQGGLAVLARLLVKTGLLPRLIKLRFIEQFLPYMFLEVRRDSSLA